MPGIVYLASYPKSGNTWLRIFLANLFADRPEPILPSEASRFSASDVAMVWYRQLDARDPSAWTTAEVAAMRHRVQETVAGLVPDTAFMKTHAALLPMAGLPPFAPHLMAGAICIVRNPLDVAPSYARHSKVATARMVQTMGTRDFMLTRSADEVEYLLGGWSQHVISWTGVPQPRFHVVRYEDMVARPHESFGGICRFLGLDASGDRFERALANSALPVLRELESRDADFGRSGAKNLFGKDGEQAFFGRGGVDAWKRDLPEEQARAIVARHRAQMTRFGYVPEGW